MSYVKTDMYLNIQNLKEGEDEKVRELLNDNNIQYKEFETPLDMFAWEEAWYRLNMFIDDKVPNEEKLKFIEEHREGLQNDIYNDDYIVDGEALDDITRNYIMDNISKEEREKYIDKNYIREDNYITNNIIEFQNFKQAV